MHKSEIILIFFFCLGGGRCCLGEWEWLLYLGEGRKIFCFLSWSTLLEHLIGLMLCGM